MKSPLDTKADSVFYGSKRESNDANSNNVLTMDDFEQILKTAFPVPAYVWYMDGVGHAFLVSVGCLGYFVVLLKLKRMEAYRQNSPFAVLFAWLLTVDLILMISNLMTNSFWLLYYQNSARNYGSHVKYVKMAFFICSTSMSCAVWITLLIAFERFILLFPLRSAGTCELHKPRKFQSLTRSQHTKFTLAAITILALIYNSPKAFELETTSRSLTEIFEAYYADATTSVSESFHFVNITLDYLQPAKFYHSSFYITFYRIGCRVLLETTGPLVAIFLILLRMAWREWLQWRKRDPTIIFYDAYHLVPGDSLLQRPSLANLADSYLGSAAAVVNEDEVCKCRNRSPLLDQQLLVESRHRTDSNNSTHSRLHSVRDSLSLDGRNLEAITRLERRLNRLVILLLLKFVLTQIASVPVAFLELSNYMELLPESPIGLQFIPLIANFLTLLNSATNPWLLFWHLRHRAQKCAAFEQQNCFQ